MSAKDIDSKSFVEESSESGYISGPISEAISEPLSSEILPSEARSSDISDLDKKVQSYVGPDSGVVDVDLLSGELSRVDLKVSTPTQSRTRPAHTQGLPPLITLYEPNEDGDSQVHLAAVHGCEKSMSFLIRRCPNKLLLDLQNDFWHTPLHLAVICNNAMIARMLVRAGASIKARDLRGETPLHIATRNQSKECIEALLGPPSDIRSDAIQALNEKNYDGQTCVHIATNASSVQMLRILLHYKADINAKEGHAGWTPLHIACWRGDEALVRYLAGRAGAALLARDLAGRTPRRLATKHHPHLAKLINTQDDDDDSTDSDDDYNDDEDDSDAEEIYESLVSMRGGNRSMVHAV